MLDKLLDREAFRQALSSGEPPLPLFRDALGQGAEALRLLFEQGEPVTDLVRLRANLIDFLLIEAWERTLPYQADAALIAVGGYGRGELHPRSDIDLLILLGDQAPDTLDERLAELLTFFWDIGLEVGHSVRTLEQCVESAGGDVTIATNLIESRLLSGPRELYTRLKQATAPGRIWPSDRFFEAKWSEQRERYAKYEGTISNLEPNVKESPGGLRDIQMIGWVVKRHFGAETLHELVAHEFLTPDEYRQLMESQEFLWRVRFALHLLTGRHEDRILFDYQLALAEQFGRLAEGIEAAGQARLDLDLTLPLDDEGEPRLDGRLMMRDAALDLRQWELPVRNIAGTLRFDQDRVRAKGIKGRLHGSPVEVDV
ncbi:MAG: hypothetical protein B0D86_02490, partial [Candidatus Sedimenticola endophacoides]